MHSFNHFHAAGHGTFFSGLLKKSANDKSFLWVYDCGSKRPTRMNALVNDLQTQTELSTIDMLCISHFDGDHVNGLKDLLSIFQVNRLFLPYVPFNKRFEIASDLDLDVKGSTDAMLFILDPVGFLEVYGFANKVREVLFVRGGEGSSENLSMNLDDTPPVSLIDERQTGSRESITSDMQYPPMIKAGAQIQSKIIEHSTALRVSNSWEFVFYNQEPPSHVAPLTNIQNDIVNILKKWNLTSGLSKEIEGWYKDLRECYSNHFGARSKERNNISMCLYSAPINGSENKECKLFKHPTSILGTANTNIPISNSKKTGILLTGDLNLTLQELTNLRSHLSFHRWNKICVMHIPHHGSRHSWAKGNSGLCKHEFSVFCVPGYDKSRNHPSACVIDDLKDKKSIFANYSNSVTYIFHLNLGSNDY